MARIYKILGADEWQAAQAEGVFAGSGVDLADGFIHFSTAGQAPETCAKHFAGRADLVILELDADHLGPSLQWEPSRGGDLFPHLYMELDLGHVLEWRLITLTEAGAHDLADLRE